MSNNDEMIISHNCSPESGLSYGWPGAWLTEFIIKDSVHSFSPQWPPHCRLYLQVNGKKPEEASGWYTPDTAQREERLAFCFYDSIFHGNTSREDVLCLERGDVFLQSMNISIPQNKSILFILDINSTLVLVVSWVLHWACCASVTPKHWQESISCT